MFLDKQETHEDPQNTLGGRIIYAQEQQSMSCAQLARRLGIETSTMQDWESDRAEPRSNRLSMLAGLLNVSPTWLLMGYGERPGDILDETEMAHIQNTIRRIRDQMLATTDELEQLQERLGSYESYKQ